MAGWTFVSMCLMVEKMCIGWGWSLCGLPGSCCPPFLPRTLRRKTCQLALLVHSFLLCCLSYSPWDVGVWRKKRKIVVCLWIMCTVFRADIFISILIPVVKKPYFDPSFCSESLVFLIARWCAGAQILLTHL